MISILAQGFLLGLAMAPACMAACAPVFVPVLLSREDARLRSHTLALGEFLCGRFVAYAAVGLLVGWIGARVEGGPLRWASVIAHALLGAALLLYAASETTQNNLVCRVVRRWGRAGRLPAALGFLTGANICPPFVAAMTRTLELGGAAKGLTFFVGFFFATALVSVPMAAAGFGNLLPYLRSVGRIACATAGLIFLCAAAQRVTPATAAPPAATRVEATESWLTEMIPGADKFYGESEPVRHYLAEGEGGKGGIVVFSDDLAPEVQGYAGRVPVAVAMDMDGGILRVRVLPHYEDVPAYVELVETDQFLGQFLGKGPADAITAGRDVDVVTGATYSSMAVIDGVRISAHQAAAEILSEVEEAPKRPATANWGSWLRWSNLVLALLIGASVYAYMKRSARLRPFVLAASFVILGLWLKTFFSVGQVLDIAMGRLPSLAGNATWYIMAVPALIFPIFFGRLYCSYLCPFGAMTEFLGRLFRSPLRVNPKFDRRLRRVKYGVLVALAVLFALTRNIGLLYVEPFADTFALAFLAEHGEVISRLAWALFILAASLFVTRFFCRYFCPAGAAMAFLARHRVVWKRRQDGCVECGECGVSCPKGEDKS